MTTKRRRWLTLRRKRALWGVVFTGPFLVGFILFFLGPMVQSIKFAFNELEITPSGYVLNYVALNNFQHALRVDPDFVRLLTETTIKMLVNIPAIIIFSFFTAALLNQKFRGRALARVIFFLPVIITSGIIRELSSGDLLHRLFDYVSEDVQMVSGSQAMIGLMLRLRMPLGFTQYIITAVDRITEIINASAIPILIFLSGLQSIPSSLYECAKIEGATGWESFWKITFPLVTPLFLTNVVYIIVDSFTAPANSLVRFISRAAWGRRIYGVSVAMTWIYFGVIAVILGIVYLIISRRVVYME